MNSATVTIDTVDTVAPAVAHVNAYDTHHVLSGTLPLVVTSTSPAVATGSFGADGRTLTITGHSIGMCHIGVDESPPAHTSLDIIVTVTAPPNLSEVALDHFDPQ